MRLRPGDARDLLQVEDEPALHSPVTVARSPSAQCSTECRSRTTSRSPGRRRRSRSPRRAASDSGVVLHEAQLLRQQVVEERARGERRHARRRGLVDDLVRGAGPHVVHEHVAAGQQRGNLGAGHRAAELAVEPQLREQPLELPPVPVVLAACRRAVRLHPHAAGERGAAEDRLQALRGRVAAEDERAQRPVVRRRLGARELGQVDGVAEAAHLGRGERERAPVDRRHGGAEPLRRPQDPVRLPVRVPEHERQPRRPHERRREQHVERDHVRDHAERARPQLAREGRDEARPPLRLGGGAELADADVRGDRARVGRGAEDDELVHARRERPDHRHRRREDRVGRIERLGGEDQPPAIRRSPCRRG